MDFDVLRQLLGAAVDEREEKYGLKWNGKRRARARSRRPPAPCALSRGQRGLDTTQT